MSRALDSCFLKRLPIGTLDRSVTCAAAMAMAGVAIACGGGASQPHTNTVASATPTGDSGGRTARQTAAQYDTAGGEAATGARMTGTQTGARTVALPNLAVLASIPVGPPAGDVIDSARQRIRNPYTGDRVAINEGAMLFIHMNCASCHGFTGGGGMGPALADEYWRFGGDDADIFNSIYWGRGQGMPSWKNAMTEDEIWKVVAYIRTLTDSAHAHTPRGGQGSTPGNARQPTANAEGGEDWREPLKGSQGEP